MAAVCAELGISTRQFRRWRDELRLLGNDAFPGQGRTSDQELTDLKLELAKVKKERDFLKPTDKFDVEKPMNKSRNILTRHCPFRHWTTDRKFQYKFS